MRFSVEKKQFLTALQKISRVSPVRTTVPILTNILFSVDGEDLYLRASDLEITMSTGLKVSSEESGTIALPTRTILELIQETPDGTLTLSTTDEVRTVLETPVGEYQIMGKPGEDFPSLPKLEQQHPLRFENFQLKRMIEKTLFAVTRDEMKPALMGVLFIIETERAIAAATDGHKLVECIRNDFKCDEVIPKKIIPPKFLNILLQEIPEEGATEIVIGENHAMVKLDDTVIYTRLIQEQYPDYRTVLPLELDRELKGNRIEMEQTLRRMSILSNPNTMQIVFSFSEEESFITTEDPESSTSARENLNIQYKGEPLVIGYNSAYLLEVIKHVDTDDFIWKFKSSIGPALVFPTEQEKNEELTMLIMPIRLGGD